MSTLKTRALAALTAVAALAMTVGGATVANAVQPTSGDISKTSDISVKFTKLSPVPTDGDPARDDGAVDANAAQGRKPIRNVQFKLTPVKYHTDAEDKAIDLSTTGGWDLAKEIVTAKPKGYDDKSGTDPWSVTKNFTANGGKYVLDTTQNNIITTKDTGDDGVTGVIGNMNGTGTPTANAESYKTGLKPTLYYVEEVLNGDEEYQKDGSDWTKANITKRMDPFFLTVPLVSDVDGSVNGFLYNINVYPKNDTTDKNTEKKAGDPSKKYLNGTTIPWNVQVLLSAPSDVTKYTKIGFTDTFQEGLQFESLGDVTVQSADYTPAGEGGVPAEKGTKTTLTAGADYTVQYWKSGGTQLMPAGASLTDEEKQQVVSIRVFLTEDGLKKAFAVKGGTLNTVVTTKVTATSGKGFVNRVNTWVDDTVNGNDDSNPDNPPTDPPTKPDTPGDKSNFATIKVHKTNTDGTKFLNDAKFSIFEIKSDMVDNLQLGDGKYFSETDLANKLIDEDVKGDDNNKVDPIRSDLVTATDGTVKTDLYVGSGNDTSSSFCLLETETPSGYKFHAESGTDKPYYCFTVTATDTSTVDTADNTVDLAPTVVNDKATVVDKLIKGLPVTGATGLVVMTAMGALLIGAGVFAVAGARRREQE